MTLDKWNWVLVPGIPLVVLLFLLLLAIYEAKGC